MEIDSSLNDTPLPILNLSGKIIGSRALSLRDKLFRLIDSGVLNVILNFQDVTAIDSLGVIAIISAYDCGISIRIIQMNSTCSDIFNQHENANEIPIFETKEEASEYLSNHLPVSKERRKYKLSDMNIPVKFLINDHEHLGVLLDMNETGVLIGHLDPLDADPSDIKSVNIEIEVPVIGSLRGKGKPVHFGRNSEMYIIRIEFGDDDSGSAPVYVGTPRKTPPRSDRNWNKINNE